MRIGEIRPFYKLQHEGQSLMRAAMMRINLWRVLIIALQA
jgi:hypothetical protein